MKGERNNYERTAATMRDTADQLEDAETILHRSAEASPDAATKTRLHRLGDQVTEAASDIARRANQISHDGGSEAG